MSTESRIVAFFALGIGLWVTVNLLLSGGLFADRIQHLVLTPLRTHLGPDVTVRTVKLTVLPTRLMLAGVTIPPFGASMDVLNSPVRIDEISMKFSPWSLLTEHLILPTMTMTGINASLRNTPDYVGPSAPLGVPFLLSQYWPREVVLRDVVFRDLNLSLGARSNENSHDPWMISGIEGRLRSDFAMQTFHLDLTAGVVEVWSPDVAKDSMHFFPIEGKMVLQSRSLEIRTFSVGGTLGHIVFHGHIDNPEMPALAIYADARGSIANIRALQVVNNMPSLMEGLHGTAHVKGEIVGIWPKVRARGVFGMRDFRIGDVALGYPRGRFSFESGQLSVKDLSNELFGGHLQGSIGMQWQIEQSMSTRLVLGYDGPAGKMQLSGVVEDTHMDLLIEGSVRDVGEVARYVGHTESLAGELDFEGSVTGTILQPEMYGRVAVKDLMVKGRYIDSGLATLAYERGKLDVAKAILRQGAGLFDIEGHILFAGEEERAPLVDLTLTSQDGSLRDLIALVYKELPIPERANGTMVVHVDGSSGYSIKGSLSFPEGQAFGEQFDEGTVEFVLNPQGATLTQLQLRQGRGTLEGKGWIGSDRTFRGSIRGRGIDAQKVNWIKTHVPGLGGKVNIHLVGSGSIDRPVLHGAARFHQLRYDRVHFGNGRADMRTRDSVSTVVASFDRRVLVNAEILWEGEKPFTASAEFSDFDASPIIDDLIPAADTVSWISTTGVLTAEGTVNQWKNTAIVGRFPTVVARINGYQLQNEEPLEGMFRDGVMAIDHFRLVGEHTTTDITGRVVPFERYDLRLAGELNPRLAQFLMNDITVEEGTGALDVRISEHWDQPRVTGTYAVRDLLLHCRFSEQPIIISTMDMQVDSETVNIQSFAGRYGNGVIQGNGVARVAEWRVDNFLVNVKVADVQYLTEPGLVATLQGDVRFDGRNSLQKITGDITVAKIESDARKTVTDFLVNDVKPLLASPRRMRSGHAIEMDIHATGTEDLRLENPLARLPLDVDLLVKGTLQQPELLGQIGSRGGSMFIGNRQFDVRDASIDFVAHRDYRALYTVYAKSVVRSHDVDLFVSGIDDQVNLSLTSDPPLEEAVILAYINGEGSERDSLASQARRRGQWDQSISIVESEGAARTLLGHRVEAEKRMLADRLYVMLSTPAVPADEQLIRLKYPVSDNFSLMGERNEEGRVVGDIRFRIEFP